jgi:hypothetical protein
MISALSNPNSIVTTALLQQKAQQHSNDNSCHFTIALLVKASP